MRENANPNRVSCSDCPYWFELPKLDSQNKPIEPEESSGYGQCRHSKPDMLVMPREIPADIKMQGGKILLDPNGQMPTRMIAQQAPAIPQTTFDFWCGDHPEFGDAEPPAD